MEISVKIIKENKDGSADAVVRYDKKGLEVLVQWGLVAMLTEAIDKYKVRPDKTDVSIQPKAKKRPVKTYTGGKANHVTKKSK
jgi:hypothetical protein